LLYNFNQLTKNDILILVANNTAYRSYCKVTAIQKRINPNDLYSEFLFTLTNKPENILLEKHKNNILDKYCKNVIYCLVLPMGKMKYVSQLQNKTDKLESNSKMDNVIAKLDQIEKIENETQKLKSNALQKTIDEEPYYYNKLMIEKLIESGFNKSALSRRTQIPIKEIERVFKLMKIKVLKNYDK